jgi:hypothetical protein
VNKTKFVNFYNKAKNNEKINKKDLVRFEMGLNYNEFFKVKK